MQHRSIIALAVATAFLGTHTAFGAEFSSALFAIWIGEQALDESLREQLLAKR